MIRTHLTPATYRYAHHMGGGEHGIVTGLNPVGCFYCSGEDA
jgi:hypothetical protein